ncbi:stage II sporulation protein M [Niabella beijingensis]|uniref:stage II sporulation protein M n=1 Tax=Niabella beijingensis TaxID=2872700 RepID=UPI001CBDC626|nr:stage II sporulation protein M [Niabella beijingensis]MBZ4188539.1 stage II sporulation protein M [Niabella beijingensis]
MREALFIKKNKDRWLKNQQQPPESPDDLAKSFTQLVDDLAYAKTFYPTSKTTQYLNKQASDMYLSIYQNRKEESSRLAYFWKYELPLVIYKHHRTVLFAFIVFVTFFLLAFFVAAKDQDVANNFFGENYVQKTMENIEEGNPFGIYESGNPVLSWLGIMINNIRVAFLFFVSGIFCGIPTLYKLAETGAMVGVFDQLFTSKGFGIQFWMVVFVHGTLEITAIILAGAAGFILGKSFLFPGTRKRIEAFREGAKDGVKIMIGILPAFIIAAFFEGLFTRLYNNASWFTTFITTASVLFVIWYFIIYPVQLARRSKRAAEGGIASDV